MRNTLAIISFLCLPLISISQFTDVAGSAGINLNGSKDGGVSFADFNNDGCLDLLVNTSDNTHKTRLFMNNCDYPNPTYSDVTSTHAPHLLYNKLDRSAVWADFNNDGYIDFARNTSWRVEVYMNQGPSGDPAWSFGDESHAPDFVATTMNGGLNTEGLAWFDYNGDGFLDLIVENHNYGLDIYRNPADCTANFFQITPNSSPLGLPTWATDGDYMATADYNDDGWVDILARKQNQNDVWRNDGGTFSNIQNIDQATNGNKGAVVWADFDNDGDFDLFWTSNGTNQIWEQTGLNSGNFVATGEPANSTGVTMGTDVDACAAADIDNDGDLDLVIVNNSGAGKVFINNSNTSSWSFTHDNRGVNVNGNGEGIVFGDYDNDGDMDLYVNKRNGNNQLWQNGTNNSNYLKVDPRIWLGAEFTRSDHGATAILYDASGTVIKSGIRDARGSFGHGCQHGEKILFGLPDGPNATYHLVIKTTNIGGERITHEADIIPSNLTDQTYTYIRDTYGTLDNIGCNRLPIELDYFKAIAKANHVDLNWRTLSEQNNNHFLIKRSSDGQHYETIAQVPGAGNSTTPTDYEEQDLYPIPQWNYYQLQQVDDNGDFTKSNIEAVLFEPDAVQVNAYPNPISSDQNEWKVWLLGFNKDELINIELINMRGQTIHRNEVVIQQTGELLTINKPQGLPAGIYNLRISWQTGAIQRKLLAN